MIFKSKLLLSNKIGPNYVFRPSRLDIFKRQASSLSNLRLRNIRSRSRPPTSIARKERFRE